MTENTMRERTLRALGGSRRHQGYRHRGSVRRGRVWVVIMFFILLAVEAMAFLDVARRLGSFKAANSALDGSTLSSFIFTTGLLGGIWCRQNWARYILLAFLGVRVLVAFVSCATIFKNDLGLSAWFTVFVMGAADTLCAWTLISSQDIRRLTNRLYD